MLVSGEEAPKGVPVGAFYLNPANRWNTTIPLNVPATGAISIFNADAQAVQVKNVSVSSADFKVALAVLEAGKRYQLAITSNEKLPVGNYNAVVKVETDSAQTPVLEIPVAVQVVSPITANPAKLTLDNLPVSNPEYDVTTYGKFIWVRFARGEGLELKSFTSDLPYLKVKIESAEGNGQTYLLRVGFGNKPPVGTHTGKIKIETNNKDVPLLEVPVTVIAK